MLALFLINNKSLKNQHSNFFGIRKYFLDFFRFSRIFKGLLVEVTCNHSTANLF